MQASVHLQVTELRGASLLSIFTLATNWPSSSNTLRDIMPTLPRDGPWVRVGYMTALHREIGSPSTRYDPSDSSNTPRAVSSLSTMRYTTPTEGVFRRAH